MATAHKLDTLRNDGFVVIRNLVPASQLESLLDEFRDVFRRQMQRFRLPGAALAGAEFDAALPELFTTDLNAYLGAAKLTQYLPTLHRLGAGGPVLDLVRELGIAHPAIATRPVIHIICDRLAVPGGYHRTPPHQDWRSVQGSLDSLVVWLPLVEIEPGFNTLEVIPGSHRWGLLETVKHPFGNVVAEGQYDEQDFVPVRMRPGDALAFSMFLVHRTGGADRSGVRWAVSFRFNNMDEPSFITRNYPNPFVYKSQDALLFEGFPAREEVERIYGPVAEQNN